MTNDSVVAIFTGRAIENGNPLNLGQKRILTYSCVKTFLTGTTLQLELLVIYFSAGDNILAMQVPNGLFAFFSPLFPSFWLIKHYLCFDNH